MPEVDVVLGTTEIEGAQATSLVFHLEAADVLKLLGLERDLDVNLSDETLLRRLGNQVASKVSLADGQLSYFGGDLEGDTVYLYFTAAPDVEILDTTILSSVYDQWTNRINDQRGDEVVTTVYTQGGALEHHHHH